MEDPLKRSSLKYSVESRPAAGEKDLTKLPTLKKLTKNTQRFHSRFPDLHCWYFMLSSINTEYRCLASTLEKEEQKKIKYEKGP